MHPNRLPEDEIKQRITELFNLVDPLYHPLNIIMHAYKLIDQLQRYPEHLSSLSTT
jgi:hypothetical protein